MVSSGMLTKQMISRRRVGRSALNTVYAGRSRGRAQWSTIPSACGAAHRLRAGFRVDPRRGNTCFPQRDVVRQPLEDLALCSKTLSQSRMGKSIFLEL
jgi:hypothetical protein